MFENKTFISIHAAREGGDVNVAQIKTNQIISIHAAREGGDSETRENGTNTAISIHAAREGGDANFCVKLYFAIRFQSTPPVKAATYTMIRSFLQ